MSNNVIPIENNKPLNKLRAQRLINEIAKDTSQIKYTTHARERMEERGFTVRDTERILQRGIIMDLPIKGEKGDWSYLVRCVAIEGKNREAACATIIISNNRLLVKTVEWIDL